MKRFTCLVLAFLMSVSLLTVGASASSNRSFSSEEYTASQLKSLNLFKGVSDTDFALEKSPSRIEALVIMLRLLGKENEILAGSYSNPFTDVPDWAAKYVGYAYENGLTKGSSATKFGTGTATDSQFMTFVLRALGYSDSEGDFTWDNPYDLATKLGVLTGSVVTGSGFLRADCATISYNALGAKLKGSENTLADKLISDGVFTKTAYEKVKSSAEKYASIAVPELTISYLKTEGDSVYYSIKTVDPNYKSIVSNWVKRMLLYTHSKKQVGSNIVYASRLSDHQPGKVSLVDFVSTNIPTDDYFTMSHQQNLSILSSIETPLIYALLHDQKMLMDYLNMIIGAMKYISDAWGNDDEHLVDDAKMLTNMIGILANNIKSEKIVLSSLCYSVAMFTCSISEKLLRLYYFRKIRNQQYFLASNATLGKLLNETTPEINALFGEDHIKNLSFFLQESGPKRIGHNYRNKLAHWSDISDKVLNPYFAALILWLFTDILNTVFLQVLIENGDISTSIE